jgi:hypothetical protein
MNIINCTKFQEALACNPDTDSTSGLTCWLLAVSAHLKPAAAVAGSTYYTCNAVDVGTSVVLFGNSATRC